MQGRVLPIVLLALLLGLALGLMSIPFLVREGTPVVSASAPLAFTANLGGGSATGQLQVAADLRFRAAIRLSADPERPVSLVLIMPEHTMSPLVPALSRGEGGEFTASGLLPMPGLWELRIETQGGRATIPFRIDG
jgi:hypothetical protein